MNTTTEYGAPRRKLSLRFGGGHHTQAMERGIPALLSTIELRRAVANMVD